MQQEQVRILIVEDYEDTRDMLRIALETEGFHVVTAANGVKLLPVIEQQQPDLIVLDVMMPWVDGFELCKAIRDNPNFQHIPIFFLSAKIDTLDIETGLAAGANEYLIKPINLTQLFTKVREYLPVAAN